MAEVRRLNERQIEQILQAETPGLLSIPGVVGTAIAEAEGALCIKVYVVEEDDAVYKAIPATLDGCPVVVQAMGKIRLL